MCLHWFRSHQSCTLARYECHYQWWPRSDVPELRNSLRLWNLSSSHEWTWGSIWYIDGSLMFRPGFFMFPLLPWIFWWFPWTVASGDTTSKVAGTCKDTKSTLWKPFFFPFRAPSGILFGCPTWPRQPAKRSRGSRSLQEMVTRGWGLTTARASWTNHSLQVCVSETFIMNSSGYCEL